jgi:hypothetical protein
MPVMDRATVLGAAEGAAVGDTDGLGLVQPDNAREASNTITIDKIIDNFTFM